MKNYYKFIKPILFKFQPETAHNLAIWALSNNLLPKQEIYRNKLLINKVFGLEFQNPVGLAAGFDKNAKCLHALSDQNFGFVEVGTITPLSQEGNEKPRLFRMSDKEAVINRMGFNNDGVELFSQRLRQWKYAGFTKKELIVGANIGKNKNSPNDASDFLSCLERVYGLCDYVVINISSPNTPGLRELQKKENLESFLSEIKRRKLEIRTKYKGRLPLLVKISPDENDENLKDIAEVLVKKKINGVIISNTSVRKNLIYKEGYAENRITGGISGKPLFKLSTETIEKFYKYSGGKIPIIGVGGIFSAEDAYEKIKKGASLIQVYSAFVYKGLGLVNELNQGLVELLKKDGFEHISQAIGVDVK
jgi:dihydroorotate dehydrogenase